MKFTVPVGAPAVPGSTVAVNIRLPELEEPEVRVVVVLAFCTT